MIDIVNELNAAYRQVQTTGTEARVLLRRTYPATAEDVWDALTDPERLARWFLPITGDLRVGGTFQLEGNAGGDILQCEPARLLRVTWGDVTSIVELRLAADGDGTAFELEHTVPMSMAGSGAGALFVGPGWDISVLGLALFLRGEVLPNPVEWESTREAQEFSRGSAHAWAAAVRTSVTATEDEIAAGVAMALAQFAPDFAEQS